MPDQTPRDYAVEWQERMQSRWDGRQRALRDAVDRMHTIFFPGIPTTALVAMTANSFGPTDDTTASGTRHEIGWYQTPGGPLSAPAPTGGSARNSWASLAVSADVKTALGDRAAVMGPNAWKTAYPDQVAVGLADYRSNGRAINRMIPQNVQGTENPGTQWWYVLCVMAYGSGPHGASLIINKYADRIASAPESYRFAALIEAAANDPACEVAHAHRIIRAWQRLFVGIQLVIDYELWDQQLFYVLSNTWTAEQSLALQDRLTAIANGTSPSAATSVPLGPQFKEPASAQSAGMSTTGKVVLVGTGAALIGGGAYYWYTRRK